MPMKPVVFGSNPARKIEHQIFHPDEERELEARLAELSGVDTGPPGWAATDALVPPGGDRLALVFGAFPVI